MKSKANNKKDIESTNRKTLNNTLNEYCVKSKYDLRTVDEAGLSIAKNVYLRKTKDITETSPTYRKIAGVVFDKTTKNFHIFPENLATYNGLAAEFTELRSAFKENNKQDICFNGSGSRAFNLFINVKKQLNELHTTKMLDIEKADKTQNIYRYLEYEKDNIKYRINFMRYTCNENGEIGCTMRQIQFHKITTDHINKGKNGVFDICYTTTDQDGEAFINSAKNICYNPPVNYPINEYGQYDETEAKKIINCFIEFIDANATS